MCPGVSQAFSSFWVEGGNAMFNVMTRGSFGRLYLDSIYGCVFGNRGMLFLYLYFWKKKCD